MVVSDVLMNSDVRVLELSPAVDAAARLEVVSKK